MFFRRLADYDRQLRFRMHASIVRLTFDGAAVAQQRTGTWVSYPGRYKCCDTFACMGPWLVMKDEIADPHNLAVSCSHRNQLYRRQHGKSVLQDSRNTG